MSKPLYRWHSVHSMHLSSEPPPKGTVWFVAQRSDRKQPCLMVQRGGHLAVAAYFTSTEEAEAFAGILGGVEHV